LKQIKEVDYGRDFTAVIATWQPFYNLAGSAAFTLAGLIFVAVSMSIIR